MGRKALGIVAGLFVILGIGLLRFRPLPADLNLVGVICAFIEATIFLVSAFFPQKVRNWLRWTEGQVEKDLHDHLGRWVP